MKSQMFPPSVAVSELIFERERERERERCDDRVARKYLLRVESRAEKAAHKQFPKVSHPAGLVFLDDDSLCCTL